MFACRLMSKGLVKVFGVRLSDGAFFHLEMTTCKGDERGMISGSGDVIVDFAC